MSQAVGSEVNSDIENPSEYHWIRSIKKHFQRLKDDKDTHDVVIHIGASTVPTHKSVLDAMSSIMTTGSVGFNSKTKIYDVHLDPQFDDHSELVTAIINSLYAPAMSELSMKDTRLAFKFSVMYKVEWLVQLFLVRFETFLKRKELDLMDLYKFAHVVWCEDLKYLCFKYFNSSEVLEGTSGALLELDVYCMKSLVFSSQIPAWKRFCLVRAWLEQDSPGRKCHFRELLSNFSWGDLTGSDHLEDVRKWVFDIEWGVSDSDKMTVLKAVSSKATTKIRSTVKCGQSDKVNEKHILTSIMEKATRYVQSNSKETLSAEEAIAMLSQTSLEPIQKQIVNEYIARMLEGKDFIGNPKIAVQIVNSFLVGTLYPRYIFADVDVTRKLLDMMERYCEWKELDFKLLEKFISSSFFAESKAKYKLRAIEITFLWIEANRGSKDVTPAVSLLGKGRMCFCDLPVHYEEMILLPFIRQRNWKIGQECIIPEHRHYIRPTSGVIELSQDLYRLRQDKSKLGRCVFESKCELLFNGKQYDAYAYPLRFDVTLLTRERYPLRVEILQQGSLYCNKIIDCYPFVLFDKKKALPRYPLARNNHRTIEDLRELLGRGYSDLHIMVF